MRFTFLLFILIFSCTAFAQPHLEGVWQGVLQKDGAKENESVVFFLELDVNGKTVTGKSREEFYKSDYYVIQQLKGNIENATVTLKQFLVEKKAVSSRNTVCSLDMTLTYVDSTGYLAGKYVSNTCRGNTGKIILYRSKIKFSAADSTLIGHYWRDRFLTDLKKGRKAPEIQEMERKNFVFQPIYFDHDRAEIKPEFYAYLSKMARVVNGHSDLRIRITGHTDADGSDIYNVDLSSRRAKAIQDFFLKCGLEAFKVVIDFKGEKMPVDNNETPEGKQKNRRVDFEFI